MLRSVNSYINGNHTLCISTGVRFQSQQLALLTKNIDGRAAAKNDDSHCEPM